MPSLREPQRSLYELVVVAAGHLVTTRVGHKRLTNRQWIWWSIVAVALVVGVASLVGSLPTRDPKVVVLSQPVVTTTTQRSSASSGITTTTQKSHASSGLTTTTQKFDSTTARVVSTKLATFPKIPRYRPVRLTIPALNVNSYVGTLGLQRDNHVQVPTSTHVVDWYRDGATPGQVGSAVILGHVDSHVGPGTFFNLKSLRTGDVIKVQLADGTIEHFDVTEVVQYNKTTFPDQLVYGSNGTRSLQLVTCGGTFDHATGHYESNVVAFSHLVSVKIPTK